MNTSTAHPVLSFRLEGSKTRLRGFKKGSQLENSRKDHISIAIELLFPTLFELLYYITSTMPPMAFNGVVTKAGFMNKTVTVTVSRWVIHKLTGKVSMKCHYHTGLLNVSLPAY